MLIDSYNHSKKEIPLILAVDSIDKLLATKCLPALDRVLKYFFRQITACLKPLSAKLFVAGTSSVIPHSGQLSLCNYFLLLTFRILAF